MTTRNRNPVSLGEAAPLGVTRWVDASGQALEHFDLDRMPVQTHLLFLGRLPGVPCDQTGAFPGWSTRFGERLRRVRRRSDRVRGLRFEHLGAHAGQSLPLRAGHSLRARRR